MCTLSLAILCDAITPRGRPNVNIKAAPVDLGGTLFPFVENIPETIGFLTWREMSKVDYSGWVAEHRPRGLNTLAAQYLYLCVLRGVSTVCKSRLLFSL